MSEEKQPVTQPILILSGHPSFAPGIERALHQTRKLLLPDLRFAASLDEAFQVMAAWAPELLIVDMDDPQIDPHLLRRQLGERSLSTEVMLVTLHPTGAVIVHDRKRSLPAQPPAGQASPQGAPDPQNDPPVPSC
ncbi:MAG: response regulator transcription factor [Anaerolineae bacterium]|jgi:DNA-binding NarL/FixJ family response regulator|nr:response regulator transcription factor [Anaerolineae bacterium]